MKELAWDLLYPLSVKGDTMKTNPNNVASDSLRTSRVGSVVNRWFRARSYTRQPDALVFLMLAIGSLLAIGVSAKQAVANGLVDSQQPIAALVHSLPQIS
jgi:hypothetical protein